VNWEHFCSLILALYQIIAISSQTIVHIFWFLVFLTRSVARIISFLSVTFGPALLDDATSKALDEPTSRNTGKERLVTEEVEVVNKQKNELYQIAVERGTISSGILEQLDQIAALEKQIKDVTAHANSLLLSNAAIKTENESLREANEALTCRAASSTSGDLSATTTADDSDESILGAENRRLNVQIEQLIVQNKQLNIQKDQLVDQKKEVIVWHQVLQWKHQESERRQRQMGFNLTSGITLRKILMQKVINSFPDSPSPTNTLVTSRATGLGSFWSVDTLDHPLSASEVDLFFESLRDDPEGGDILRHISLKACYVCKMLKLHSSTPSNRLSQLINEYPGNSVQTTCCSESVCSSCWLNATAHALENDWWHMLDSQSWIKCPVDTCQAVTGVAYVGQLSTYLRRYGDKDIAAHVAM
jgi:regulator of replication initiation timing